MGVRVYRVRAVLLTVAMVLTLGGGLLVTGAPANAAGRVAVSDTFVTARCGGQAVRIPMRWYIPSGTPTGLVWLQHGFTRAANDLRGLASSYARDGMLVATPQIDTINRDGCIVSSIALIDNHAFVATMGRVFGDAWQPGSALAASLNRAGARVGRSVAMPDRMIFAGHSNGAEFVLVAANELRRSRPASFNAHFAGLTLLDPGRTAINNDFAVAAKGLGGRTPIRIVAARLSPYNYFGTCVGTLLADNPGRFLGARLVNGNHMDAEGASTDLLGYLFELRAPVPRDVAVVARLSTAWSSDLLRGTRSAAFYPGGGYYGGLVRAGMLAPLR